MQPAIMPRPDVAAIGTNYRRIPLMAIGRDIYNDTRLILHKLEALYPSHPSIRVSSPSHAAVERLLEHWAVDNLFGRAAQLIPADSPIMRDASFVKDRADFSGRSFSGETIRKMRPEALVEIKTAFGRVEEGLLADGREWILKTPGLSLADVEGVWIFHWLTTIPGALPPDYISATQFPKVFAWIARFNTAIKAAALKNGKAKSLKGNEAVAQISAAGYAEPEGSVDTDDPTGLKKGQEIEVWPIDSGFNNKDRGRLVALDGKEIVIESKTESGRAVRVHTPRHGFRLRSIGRSSL